MCDLVCDAAGLTAGIDLGTTNSCIAIWQNGEVKVLFNQYNETTTPSCVAFTKTGISVGNAALLYTRNTSNTIYESKRIIGQPFQAIKNVIQTFPFTITNESRPLYNVQVQGKEKKLHPEEISGIILKKLKQDAENQLQREVKDVVITVPAYFNDEQCEATKMAASIAGLNVLKLIAEPVAAALAFGQSESPMSEEQNLLVYDLSGGTFDTAIVSVNSMGVYDVRATNGNTRLGGAKFVDRLVKFFIAKANDTHIDTNFSSEEMARIRRACESAIKALSNDKQTVIIVDELKISISRNEYNKLIQPYIDVTITCVLNALDDAGLQKNDIDKIVLIGGCTNTPLIQTSLAKVFGKDCNIFNPMEAVARGACIQAAVLKQMPGAPVMYVRNVTPLTIGLSTSSGLFCPVIKRNNPFPTIKRLQGKTRRANQSRAKIELFEGESPTIEGNKSLGYFFLDGLTISPKGQEIIEVSIQIDDKGKICAMATDLKTKKQNQFVIDKPQCFSEQEISQMTQTVAQFQESVDIEDVPVAVLKTKLITKRIKIEHENHQVEFCPIYGHKKISTSSKEPIELGE